MISPDPPGHPDNPFLANSKPMTRIHDEAEWKVISKILHGEDVAEVMATSCQDGIGILARWVKTPEGWTVMVWHTEMPSEGIEGDDGDSVPEVPEFLFENPLDHASGSRCRCRSYNRPDWGGDQNEVILEAPEWSSKDNGICVDACIVDAIKLLWANSVKTFGCCCGHNGAVNNGRPSVHVDDVEKAQKLLEHEGRDWMILSSNAEQTHGEKDSTNYYGKENTRKLRREGD